MGRTPSNSAPEFIMNVDGASAVAHQTVLIVSDSSDFARAITSKWQSERNSPTFLTNHLHLQPDSFDLVIIGTTNASVFDLVQSFSRPVIHVSPVKGQAAKFSGVIHVPEIDGWPNLVITLAKQILEREKLASDLAHLSEAGSQLEREASLGRYMLEMRHSLNNALTSILGNSELMLMENESLSPALRTQVETIRNMGMRMNEILQRFSSLQKEMQLTDQQVWKKAAKASAGA